MKVRGFALPYDFEIEIEDVREHVLPGAFRQMIASGCDVKLYSHSHTKQPSLASIQNDTLMLFETPHALAFEADLPDSRYATTSLVAALITAPRVSVNFDLNQTVADETVDEDGITSRSIRRAVIDHVCVALGGAAYDSSAWCLCWPVIDTLFLAPQKIKTAAIEWGAAYTRYAKSSAAKSKAPVVAAMSDASLLIASLKKTYPGVPPQALAIMCANETYGHDPRKWPTK